MKKTALKKAKATAAAIKTVVTEAKTAKKPMVKVAQTDSGKRRGIAAAQNEEAFRFTKAMTQKRQASKGTARKQGGPKFAPLPEKKLRSFGNEMEAGPTEVS